MASISTERPIFKEGYFLSADDLTSIVDYFRIQNARQNLGQHSWGVAIGLDLVSQEVSETAVEYYVQPGVAIDGYGRIIVVSNPVRIEADEFVNFGSGNIDVWIRYDESDFSSVRPGFNQCSAMDDYTRVSESFKIVVGNKNSILDRQSGLTINDNFVVDAREALISVDPDAELLCDAAVPHQQFPEDDDNALWLVPLGHVKWTSATNSFSALVDPVEEAALEDGSGTSTSDEVYEALLASRAKRRLIGSVTESIYAADGVIRLRERSSVLDTDNDTTCHSQHIQSEDLYVCDGRLMPKELVWLEGNTRIEGDARLLSGRLEFKDKENKDYIERTVSGITQDAITPMFMQRDDGNSKSGTDLKILLGKSTEGINRLSIGNVEFDGSDLCDISKTEEMHVVIQDNGRMGIGTTSPDSTLTSPYTVRGLQETITENEGTEDEFEYNIYRLENYEADNGVVQWQMDLWDKEESERKSLSFTESGLADTRLFLENGGNIGIGTSAPTEQLHILGDDPALFIDINSTSGLHNTELQFGSDGSMQSRIYWSKSSDKLFVQHHSVTSLVIDEDKIGMGTSTPQTSLHIARGEDVDLSDAAGYLLLGDINGTNLVLDDNEIQARNNGSASQLHLQVEGGEFSVHWGDSSEFRINEAGDVGIGTNSPNEKLDVRGDIKLGSSGDLFAMSAVENVRCIIGRVNSDGTEQQGAGYSVNRTSTGEYSIQFAQSFAGSPSVVVTLLDHTDNIVSVGSITSSSCNVRIRDIRGRYEDIAETLLTQVQNAEFSFIAIGER